MAGTRVHPGTRTSIRIRRTPRLATVLNRAWIGTVLLCATPVFAAVTATPQPSNHATYAAIGSSIEAEIASGRLTGVAVAVVKNGKIVWEDGFGWADRETGRKATSRTPFSIASTSKPFTTTSLMTMVAAGKLDLDKPANDYLGEDKIVDEHGPAQAATLRRLATHSSGLPTYFAMYPEGGDARQPSVAEVVRDYGHLVARVGERYEYSNLAMAVLADIVARQSKQEYGKYLQAQVLTPLGMKDSFFDTDTSRRKEMAVRYDDDGKALPFYLTATPGSGEVYASAHDLARFAMFHLKDRLPDQAKILSDAQIDELHRPGTTVAPDYSYGMGWQIMRRPGEPEVLYHGGGQTGVSADFVLVPSQHVAYVMVSNRHGNRAFFDELRDRTMRTVLPSWHGLPAQQDPPLAPLAPLKAYVGQWQGTLRGQGRIVPVTLTIAPDAKGTLSVDGGPAQPITDLGLIDGWISGDTKGDIGSADTQRWNLDKLSLSLKLRDRRIDGEIIAWQKTVDNMTVLPYWTQLDKR